MSDEPDKYVFDPDQLTGEHLEDFEEQVGQPLFAMADLETGEVDLTKFTGRAFSGLMWLAMRMSGHDDATFEEARKEPMTRLDMSGDEDEDEADPTDASSAS